VVSASPEQSAHSELTIISGIARFLNVPAMPQPEAYIGGADKLFDANGRLVSDGMRKFLQGFMQAYAVWIAANMES